MAPTGLLLINLGTPDEPSTGAVRRYLRQFLSENYGHVMRQFTAEFARLLPQLSREELYWRIDLVTGALTHAMSGFGMIQRKSDVTERSHREQTAAHLIRFAVAGLSHP